MINYIFFRIYFYLSLKKNSSTGPYIALVNAAIYLTFTILNAFSHNHNLNYVVKGVDGNLAGIITLEHLKEVMQIGDFAESMLAMDVMDSPSITCKPSTLLPDAYKLFEEYDTDAIPIVDANGEPLGILEKNTVDHFLHSQIIQLNRKLEKLDD